MTRDPSFSRASHIGSDSSTRRPIVWTMRSITRRRLRSSSKDSDVSSILPRRSTKICSGLLTMISLTSGSRSSASSGPRPITSSNRISTRRSLSTAVTTAAGGLERKCSSVSCSRRRRMPARLLMSIWAVWCESSWAWISAFAAASAGLRLMTRSASSGATSENALGVGARSAEGVGTAAGAGTACGATAACPGGAMVPVGACWYRRSKRSESFMRSASSAPR